MQFVYPGYSLKSTFRFGVYVHECQGNAHAGRLEERRHLALIYVLALSRQSVLCQPKYMYPWIVAVHGLFAIVDTDCIRSIRISCGVVSLYRMNHYYL